MNLDDISAWRKERMRALSTKFGGDAPLGRAMGFKSGAYIGQMIGGDRPITEKTMQRAENLPGCHGWFSHDGNATRHRNENQSVSPFSERRRPLTDTRQVLESLFAITNQMDDTNREMACIAVTAMILGKKSIDVTTTTLNMLIAQYLDISTKSIVNK